MVDFPAEYIDNYDKTKQYYKILFLHSRGVTQDDLNQLQSLVDHKRVNVIDSLLNEGDVLRGGLAYVDSGTGETKVEAGKIYISEDVIDVPEKIDLTLPVDKRVDLGVFLEELVITAEEDGTLRDITELVWTAGKETSVRLQKNLTWGWKDEDGNASQETGTFYPVYLVNNGVLITGNQTTPQLSKLLSIVGNYDYEAHGNYQVEGLTLEFEEEADDKYVYNLKEGTANIIGAKRKRTSSERLSYDVDPDPAAVNNEIKAVNVSSGEATITANNPPLIAVANVEVILQKTENITRGGVAGGADSVTEDAVDEIISITGYTEGVDYLLTDNQIDWSPGGIEPGSSTSYSVTYNFIRDIGIKTGSLTDTNFIIEDQGTDTLVDGKNCKVDYTYKLPRYDSIEIKQDGTINRVKGIPGKTPSSPKANRDAMKLASIFYDWINDPLVIEDTTNVVKMSTLNRMQQQLFATQELLADQIQKNNSPLIESAAHKGIFVDTFSDDTQRDTGYTQGALITDNLLTLPITLNETRPADANNGIELHLDDDASYEVVVGQTIITGNVRLNPYSVYIKPPEPIVITPQVNNNVPDYTGQSISGARNTDPVVIIRDPFPTGGNTPQPQVNNPSFKEAYDQLRGVAKDFKGTAKVNKKQNAKIIDAAIKMAAGESPATVRIRGKELPIT